MGIRFDHCSGGIMTFWSTRSLLKGLSSLSSLLKPFVTMRALWKRSSRGIQMITAQCKAFPCISVSISKKKPTFYQQLFWLISDLSCWWSLLPSHHTWTAQDRPKDGPLTAARQGQGKAPWHTRATGLVCQSNGPKAGDFPSKETSSNLRA